jgi:hypothetical protein
VTLTDAAGWMAAAGYAVEYDGLSVAGWQPS